MSDRAIADYITPSEEITRSDGTIDSTGLLDEVNIYNLYDDRESPEQDAERILEITYPTDTLKTIIENTAENLRGGSEFSEGGQIIGGGFGSGKSHIEIVVYHLFNSPELGQSWLDQQGIDAELPAETRATALQMFNLNKDYNRLSEAVGDYLGIDEWTDGTDLPTVHEIRDALDDKPTLILLDEFERWHGMKNREAYQDDNLAFLQNLLEAAGRDDTRLSVFVSLLYENEAAQTITQRTNPFTYDLSSRRDEKIQFLLHRLIGEVTDPEGVESLAKEYTDVYRQNGQIQLEDYHQMEARIEQYYPFHPVALDLLMEKYSEQKSSSDARGLLRFLTEILADNYTDTELILTGDIDVNRFTDRFQYIDSELVGKYVSDYNRLEQPDGTFPKFIEELLNIVLLHSLARGGEEGANKRSILMGLIRKGINAHEIIQTFTEGVYGHAWHIHRLNGEYAFDVDENPTARIEKKAEDIHKHDAIHRIESLVREELFDGRNNVYIYDPVNTTQEIPDNKALKIVVSLAAKQDYNEIYDELTTEQAREFNNTIVLVTPQKRSGIDTNTGILQLARKVVAGEQLKNDDGVLPEGFDEIHDQNYQNLLDRVRDKFGTVHTPTERGLFPEDLSVDEGDDLYTATTNIVSPDSSQLKSEVKEAVEETGGSGIEYGYLRNDFHREPEYSTITEEIELEDAINSLCQDGEIQVGVYFEQRVGSLGTDTNIVDEQYVAEEEGEEEDDSSGLGVDTTGTDDDGEEQEGSTTDTPGESSTTEAGEDSEDEPVTEGPETPTIDSHPSFGTINADSKPDLIDTLERDIQGWEVHEATITLEGSLQGDELDDYGIGSSGADTQVTLKEEFEIEFDSPVNHQSFLGTLWDLDVPEDASLSAKLEVNKHE
jgi:hypothetical protein